MRTRCPQCGRKHITVFRLRHVSDSFFVQLGHYFRYARHFDFPRLRWCPISGQHRTGDLPKRPPPLWSDFEHPTARGKAAVYFQTLDVLDDTVARVSAVKALYCVTRCQVTNCATSINE